MIPGTAGGWHYESEGAKIGPVPERRLRELVAGGEITAETLVWTPGMSDWLAYGEVFRNDALAEEPDPEAGFVTCAYSGKRGPESEMLPFGDLWVAPEHREAFVQRLREGGGEEEESVEGYPFDADLSLHSLYRQTWAIWVSNWGAFAAFGLLVWAPFCFLIEYLAYESPDEGLGPYYRMNQIFEFFLGSLVSAGGYGLTRSRWEGGGPVTLGALFRTGAHHYGKVLGTRFLMYLFMIPVGILIGFVAVASGSRALMILAGIGGGCALVYFGTRFSSAEAFAVFADSRPAEGFRLSWEGTRGRFWRIFAYRTAVYLPFLLVVTVVNSVTAIPYLDHFAVSALASLATEAIVPFVVVFEMVLAIHLNATRVPAEP